MVAVMVAYGFADFFFFKLMELVELTDDGERILYGRRLMVRNALHHTEKSFMLLDVVWKQYYHSSVCTFLNFKNEGSHESEKYFN